MENKDMTSVLDRLAGSLEQCGDMQQVYLDSMQEKEYTGGATGSQPSGQFRINEGKLPPFLQLMGIRSLTVHDTGELSNLLAQATAAALQVGGPPRQYFRDRALVGHLRVLFGHTTTIAFADWAVFTGASDSWDDLLTQVIKPLNRKDLEFVFYLGNITATPVFLVDEMLDIMGDYSRYGATTFILEQEEMMKLWQGINGINRTKSDSWPFDYEEKYRSLFNALKVHRLLVYANNGVSLYAKDQQFNLSRRVLPANIEKGSHARNDYINGYSMGLTLHFDIALCIALGIVFYAAKGEYKATPDRQVLLNYINTWKSQN